MLQAIKFRVLLITLALVNACNPAQANPTGPAIVNGSPTFSGLGTGNLEVTNTRGSIINWSDFSIDPGQITRFIQPDAVSAVLNRVTGANPSNIFGTLTSNGRVFIINPNGIIFGANAAIDVQGLVASTLDISDTNFLAGTYNFVAGVAGENGNITLQNGATITTATAGDGGQVWLFANNIDQQGGSITTPAGQTILAASKQVQVAESSMGQIVFTVLTNNNNNINTLGTIAADRGVAGLFADTITHGGTINARSSGGVQGVVLIEADNDLTVANDNPATPQKEGVINVNSLDATKGGRINLVAANRVEILPLAEVSADGGPTGGEGGVILLRANDLRVSPVANGRGNLHAKGVNGAVTLEETGSSTYSAEGTETRLNSTTANDQGQLPGPNNAFAGGTSKVTTLADGRYIVVWGGAGAGDNSGVFGRLFNANGTPVGSDFRINPDFGNLVLNQATTLQAIPQVTALKNGNFVVTWSGFGTGETTDTGVFGQIYNNTGVKVGNPFLVNTFTTGNQAAAPITALADGGFIISWASEGQDGNSWGVYGRRFDANGNGGNDFRVNTTTAGNQGALQGVSSVTGLADGGFVVTWGSQGQDQAAVPIGNANPLVQKTDNAFGIYGQRYDINGNPVGGEFKVNTTTILSQQEPKVTGLSNGGFVVTWASDQDLPQNSASGFHEDIFAQRYDPSGNPVGAEFKVNGFNQLDQESPAVSPLADGGFIVTWHSLNQEGGTNSGRGVYGKRYKADGTAVGGEFLVNTNKPDNQWYSDVSALSDGDFVVTWSSVGQDGSGSGVYGQRYSKNSATVEGNNRLRNELNPVPVLNTRPGRQNANFIPTAAPTTLNILSTAPNTPIAIPVPTDPDKDQLTATIDALPDVSQGTIFLPDGVTAVTQGQTISAAELIGLQFKPTTTASTVTQTLRYTVKDGQGGVIPQTATLNITAAPPIPDEPPIPPVVFPVPQPDTPPTGGGSEPVPQPDTPSTGGGSQPDPTPPPSTPDDDQSLSSLLAEIEQGLGIATELCGTAERENDPVTNSTLNTELCKREQRTQLNPGEAVIRTNLQVEVSKQEEAYAQMVGEAEYTLTRQLSWKARQAYWDERQQKEETLSSAGFNAYLNRIRNLSVAQRVKYYEQLAQSNLSLQLR